MRKSIFLIILVLLTAILSSSVSAIGPTCGGSTPCVCGAMINESRTLNSSDNLANCGGNGLVVEANGITIDCDGNTISGIGGGQGISATGYSGITIKNCSIEGFTTGIQLSNSQGNTIQNNDVINNVGETGIHLSEVNCSTIENSNVSNNDYGIWLTDSHGNTLQNNVIKFNTNGGVILTSGSTNNAINGGEVGNNNDNMDYGGVYLEEGSTDNIIIGVYMHDNREGAILMYYSDDNVIDGNNIVNNCGDLRQIYIRSSDNIVIQKNNVTNGTGHGIEIYYSIGTQILNNNISDNNWNGIYIDHADSDHTITGNDINDNNNWGIYLQYEDNVTISDNDILFNSDGGVYASYSEGIYVDNNTFDEGNYGVYFYDTSNGEITNNYIEDFTDTGVSIITKMLASNNLVQGNTINNTVGRTYGIYVLDDNNEIKNNVIECDDPNGPFIGIYLDGTFSTAEDNAFSGNEVYGCLYGFYAEGGGESLYEFLMDQDSYHDNCIGVKLSWVGDMENRPTISNSQIYENCEGTRLDFTIVNIEDTDYTDNNPNAHEYCEGDICAAALADEPGGPEGPAQTGILLNPAIVDLENGNLIRNGDWGILDNCGNELNWLITDDIVCQDNDVWIYGSMIPLGGSITATNCSIWVNEEEIDLAGGQQGYLLLELNTAGDNEDAIGGSNYSIEAEVHTNTGYDGNVKIMFYNENPGGSGFLLSGLGTWINISPVAEINLTWMILKVYYTDEEVSAAALDENTLRLEYYNATSDIWEKFDSPNGGVNTTANYVWANVTHFSVFGIGGSAPTSTGGGGGGRCTPQWSCTEWSECISEEQTRTCVDVKCGKTTHPTKPEETQKCACKESWICSNWGDCINGRQRRECADLNACGTEDLKPHTKITCEEETKTEESKETTTATPEERTEEKSLGILPRIGNAFKAFKFLGKGAISSKFGLALAMAFLAALISLLVYKIYASFTK